MVRLSNRKLAAVYVAGYAVLMFVLFLLFDTILNVFIFTLISTLIVSLIAKFLNFFKIKGKISIIIAILIYFFIIVYGIILTVPAATKQIGNFVTTLNKVFDSQAWAEYFSNNPELLESVNSVMAWVKPKLNELMNFVLDTVAKGTPTFFTTMFYTIILTIYILLYSGWLKKSLPNLFPRRTRKILSDFMEKLYLALSSFVDVIVINAVITALAFYLVSSVYFPDSAIILSFWAGVTNLIPIVGVFFEYIPVFLFSLTLGLKGFILMNVFVVMIHLGLFIIFVNVMKLHLNVNPVLMIVSIIVVNQIFGLVGAFFAVPLLIFVAAFWEEFVKPEFER
ncbi:AI-2E family transporter [Thermosipho ferrireducens]|uniref:AI-2E family transporter n=1 Tax=Thermosipho ferrireducens TaxID=2571116 RepID=A0ABX7S7N8_9BACT|nr:AI-2E family transporter [Thermosipho ferrireducens]QTA38608.1 AI-2E family transporter [Thermosipho ferrireducens]